MAHALADPTDFGNAPGDGPLRVGGETATEPASPQAPANLPSTRSPASDAQTAATNLCRDVAGGTATVRSKGQVYLPKAPAEDVGNYQARLKRSVFYNMFLRTVEGLTGLIFRKDPVLADNVPPRIKADWEDLDLAGTHGDVFLRDIEADAMTVGHAAILVDFPPTGGTQSRADEQALALRPYWVPIRKEDIMSWRTDKRGGATILTQLVLRETTWVDDGKYGETEQVHYRVFTNREGVVGVEVLQVNKDRTVTVIQKYAVYPTQTEIPVSEIATNGKTALFESEPPLLDVAFLNVAHYQMWSDYAQAIHLTNVPIFVTTGLDLTDENGNPVTLTLGPNNGVNIPEPSGNAFYASHNGASLESTKEALDDLKSDIGALGLGMLAPQPRAQQTAEAKRLDKSTSDSALSVSARALQDAVERLLGFHAKYYKLDSGGEITVNRDFEGMAMDHDVMSAYAELGSKLGLPVDVIIKALHLGGRIPEDIDLEDLELRMMAGQIANQIEAEQRESESLEDVP
jgi:hypothetical protein